MKEVPVSAGMTALVFFIAPIIIDDIGEELAL
jgi:hypothetical protein